MKIKTIRVIKRSPINEKPGENAAETSVSVKKRNGETTIKDFRNNAFLVVGHLGTKAKMKKNAKKIPVSLAMTTRARGARTNIVILELLMVLIIANKEANAVNVKAKSR